MYRQNKIIQFLIRKREPILVLFLILIYFIHRFISYKLGLYMEECRDANAHLMILNAKVPYKDFTSWVYGPFAFCVYPLIFKIFGVNLVVFRLSFIIISLLIIPLVYYLARRLMTPIWAGLSAFLSVLLIDVPYYTYNHILASVAGLCALLFFVRFLERHHSYTLFLTGIFIGISLLVKPFFMGFGILFSIFLFMFFLKFKRAVMLSIKLNHITILTLGILSILIPFLVYFIIQGSLYEFLINITPLGANPASSFYVYSGKPFPTLASYWQSARGILPYRIIFSPSQWKIILVHSYDRLILFSPLVFPLIIVLLNKYIFRKYNLISKDSIVYFILFTLFSIFISIQSLIFLRQMGRSFTMQVPFILVVYFLSLINDRKLYQKVNFFRYMTIILSVGFIFYLTFLHFFRYPYSRYKKYILPLELERAKGIRVTYPEKQFYESMNKFLSENIKANESIAVIGYYPQFSFLCQKRNVFGTEEDVFVKLSYLSIMAQSESGPINQKKLKELEDHLIDVLKLEKPKFILEPIILMREYLTARLNKYIDEMYVLEKTFGPAEIDIYTPGIVKVYSSKE